MKIKIKRIVGVLATVLLSILVLQYFGQLLDPEHVPIEYEQIKNFHELKENSLDIVFLGSSHSWKGVDTKQISDTCGVNAYNYSCHWQHMNTTNLFLQDCLVTQKPKVVFIETGRPEVLKDVPMNGEIYYTRFLPNTEAKKTYLEQCFQGDLERYVSFYMPIISFHESWDMIQEENFASLDSKSGKFKDTCGFNPSAGSNQVTLLDYTLFQPEDLDDDSISVLDEMVESCHEKGIEVVFITIPIHGNYPYIDSFKEYAERKHCDYINFFELTDEIALNGETDFVDNSHLNTSGAAKVSTYLANYIKEKGYSN